MAQQDTGMGWNAKSEWLMSTSGEMARRSYYEDETNFPGQPIPYVDTDPSMQDVANVGMTVGRYKYDTSYEMRVASNLHNVFVCRESTSDDRCYFLAPGTEDWANGKAYWVAYNPTTGQFYNSYVTKMNLNSYYIRGSSVHYNYTASMNVTTDNRLPIHSVNSTLATIITNAAHSEIVYKLNPGYAVACVATWYDIDGDENTSPILISTNADYATISLDGETPATQARYTGLYQGVNFIMSYITDLPELVTSSAVTVDLRQFAAATPKKLFSLLAGESFANILVTNSPDPYEEQTDPSEEEGGDGEDIQNDEIDFTPAPTSMAVASGFITLFCPSQAELNALADYMWSPLFDVDTLKKLFANPMDCILGLSVIPVPIVPEGTKTVKVGGVSTTVSMGYTNHQYYPVDCGTVTIPKRWGAYMDYTPYTKLNIFLPYIGFRQISADDVMGKTLHLRYMIDILSGACNAELKVNNTVLYSWAGSCAMQIPITGNDWRSAITAGVSIAGSVAATVLSGGASAPMIAGTVASATVNSLALKPEVQRSGSLSSASGFLAAQRPYIVRTNPRNAIPANQNKYSGYPSFVTVSLGRLTGYNEVYSVHLENIPATGAELDEIETILKGGVIF